ncbi:hypothetical protein POM88_026321 [Heracleum sosnowskyi]|uniref:RNA polymerase Rpb2 domain-containing protein n=1 Tax=Heracleum sosnowskyi TaxID=360622 RepID=A0AAD8MNS1_9APIA|nr:hypothetical protein POM88_026321 [Heracleum sosnowskyi]
MKVSARVFSQVNLSIHATSSLVISGINKGTTAAITLRDAVMEKEKIYLSLNQFEKKVPIMVVMKAMGNESDQEVVKMLGRDPRYGALLLPSIEVNLYFVLIFTSL